MPPRKNAARTVVRVSNDAYLTMVFAAAEAAITGPSFRTASYKLLSDWERERGATPVRRAPLPPSLLFSEAGLEVGGVGVGTIDAGPDLKVISVNRAMTTTAIAFDDGLHQSDVSSVLVADLCEATGKPWGTVCLDWHSHVVMDSTPREIVEHQLFGPSEIDLADDGSFPHCESSPSLIVSVGWAGRSTPKNVVRSNLFYRRIGDFSTYLTAFNRGQKWDPADPKLEIQVEG